MVLRLGLNGFNVYVGLVSGLLRLGFVLFEMYSGILWFSKSWF